MEKFALPLLNIGIAVAGNIISAGAWSTVTIR
jgi:hypothetical protein